MHSPAQPSSQERYLRVSILKFVPRLELAPNVLGVELIKEIVSKQQHFSLARTHANTHNVQLCTPCSTQGAQGLCSVPRAPHGPHLRSPRGAERFAPPVRGWLRVALGVPAGQGRVGKGPCLEAALSRAPTTLGPWHATHRARSATRAAVRAQAPCGAAHVRRAI